MFRRHFLSSSLGLLTTLLIASAPAVAQERTPKVLIIGVDGTRPDALLAAKAPHLKALAQSGAFSYKAQTEEITISGPSWSSMLTGVHYEKHGVRDNSFKGENYHDFPPIFCRIKQTNGKLQTASVVTWAPINYWIVSHCDYGVTCPNDAATAAAGAALLRDRNPDIAFIHFDEVDEAGHAKGYGSTFPSYIDAIETADTHVGTVLAALRARPTYAREDWLIIVSTDHGGQGRGHGPNTPECRTTFVILSGDSAAKGEITPAPSIVDIPATALAHLGIDIKPDWKLDGHPIGLAKRKA